VGKALLTPGETQGMRGGVHTLQAQTNRACRGCREGARQRERAREGVCAHARVVCVIGCLGKEHTRGLWREREGAAHQRRLIVAGVPTAVHCVHQRQLISRWNRSGWNMPFEEAY